MPDHMSEWLGAYLDGELHGNRRQRVEAHLAQCESCREELQSLKDLSAEMHAEPRPDFPSPQRFAAQVNLRLPHRRIEDAGSQVLEIGWWMIPVSLLSLWLLITTVTLVGDLVSAAQEFGVIGSLPALPIAGPTFGADWSATLERTGMLGGTSLQWAEETEALTRTVLPGLILQGSLALLYLSWIATWWARHTRQGYGRPIES